LFSFSSVLPNLYNLGDVLQKSLNSVKSSLNFSDPGKSSLNFTGIGPSVSGKEIIFSIKAL